ncbi:heme o synthase [Candidatus Protochlamydia phocaeensis]|uniref:heme o synthase n=1 Tax=Candidatus Protochlamydia phocaeensis TaxID=1414722 RepID=UPI0008396EF8|nr:heme o synthase [Candidatus Protochlamydia phocaeensis]
MIKTYYMLTKPGIIMGNAMTAAGGFALASRGHINVWLLLATLLGVSLVVASSGIFNNYLDREADEKMERTKHRPLARKLIKGSNALIFASCLGIGGFLILALYTNMLAVFTTAAGFVIYVGLYGVWKYRSIHGTLIGSLSGAVPPVIGYCAASNRFDMGALILFLILVLWQMPHFLAIAMYRFDDYKAADLPVLPIKKGMHVTKVHMLLYILAFIVVALMPTVFHYTGYAYLFMAALLGLIWLGLCIQGFMSDNNRLWARSMFRFSLVTITLLCVMLSIDTA